MTWNAHTKWRSPSAKGDFQDDDDLDFNPSDLSDEVLDPPEEMYAPQDIQDSQDSHDPQDLQDSQDVQGNSENHTRVRRQASDGGDAFSFKNTEERLCEALRLTPAAYVRQVYEFVPGLREDVAMEEWTSPMFDFARFCKAHPALISLTDYEAMQTIEDIMYGWDDLPSLADPWEHYFPEVDDADAAQIDFMTSWAAVRHIPFRTVLQNALQLSVETPLTPALERGRLYLPTREVGELLGCNQRTVSSLRRFAVVDGLLTIVKGHTFRSTGKGEATEFRFAVEMFSELGEEGVTPP
jgi:hypothetical protein